MELVDNLNVEIIIEEMNLLAQDQAVFLEMAIGKELNKEELAKYLFVDIEDVELVRDYPAMILAINECDYMDHPSLLELEYEISEKNYIVSRYVRTLSPVAKFQEELGVGEEERGKLLGDVSFLLASLQQLRSIAFVYNYYGPDNVALIIEQAHIGDLAVDCIINKMEIPSQLRFLMGSEAREGLSNFLDELKVYEKDADLCAEKILADHDEEMGDLLEDKDLDSKFKSRFIETKDDKFYSDLLSPIIKFGSELNQYLSEGKSLLDFVSDIYKFEERNFPVFNIEAKDKDLTYERRLGFRNDILEILDKRIPFLEVDCGDALEGGVDFYLEQGINYMRVGEYGNAYDSFRKAIYLSPNNEAARGGLMRATSILDSMKSLTKAYFDDKNDVRLAGINSRLDVAGRLNALDYIQVTNDFIEEDNLIAALKAYKRAKNVLSKMNDEELEGELKLVAKVLEEKGAFRIPSYLVR